MKIMLVGGDGYLGWPLALRLGREHPEATILVLDCFLRRKLVLEAGGSSLLPLVTLPERITAYNKVYQRSNITAQELDASDYDQLDKVVKAFKPEVVYHLGHQPSAPYSMLGAKECLYTVRNNELSNLNILWSIREHCPEAHLIKLGSFGAYACPGVDIPEGYFYPVYKNKTAKKPAPFPRAADDVYHITKINDSNFLALASSKWGLRITDVMQSTVFGSATLETIKDPALNTRFDYDALFGTVLNRFVTQALAGVPLLVYGSGQQRTGLMALPDCIKVLAQLAVDPAKAGEHRVVNNVSMNYSIKELAALVTENVAKWGIETEVLCNSYNPRYENDKETLEYNIETSYLNKSIKPQHLSETLHQSMEHLIPFKQRINKEVICPQHSW